MVPNKHQPAIEAQGISKAFGSTIALDRVSLAIEPGTITALLGPSGSGKSTLLRLVNGLLPADQGGGSIRVLGSAIQENGELSPHVRKVRRRIGFIFQQFNLVPRVSLFNNVMIGGLSRAAVWRNLLLLPSASSRRQAMEALHAVGLSDKAAQRASTLSGGQMQRGAIARAIMQQADVVLADEPIASLDPDSALRVMELLRRLAVEREVTVLVSLHQVAEAKRYCDRIIALKEGRIAFDGPSAALDSDTTDELYRRTEIRSAEQAIAIA